jgi:hypothetical protein
MDVEELNAKFDALLANIEDSQASRDIRRIRRMKRYGSKRVKVLLRKLPTWYLPATIRDHMNLQRWARVLISERKRS